METLIEATLFAGSSSACLNSRVEPPFTQNSGGPVTTTHQPHPKRFDDLKSIGGAVLAVVVGVINFMGLKDDEVLVVIRNDPSGPALVETLLMASILAALFSVFLPSKSRIRFRGALGLSGIILGLIILAVQTVPLSAAVGQGHFAQTTTLGIGVALIVVGAGVFVWGPRFKIRAALISYAIIVVLAVVLGVLSNGRQLHGQWPGLALAAVVLVAYSLLNYSRRVPEWFGAGVKPLTIGDFGSSVGISATSAFLATSVLLAGVAVYSATRLEAASQASSTYARIEASISYGKTYETMTVHVQAAKLKNNQEIDVELYGLPKHTTVFSICHGNNSCSKSPCVVGFAQCNYLFGSNVDPDQDGSVKTTLTIPFKADPYSQVMVQARLFHYSNEILPSSNMILKPDRKQSLINFVLP